MKSPMENGGVPLAERMRPGKLEDILGQDHLVGPGSPLRIALESGRIFSVIFWGPPGSGKTTLAALIPNYAKYPFQSFSAVTSGVKDLRQVIEQARRMKKATGSPTVLFVDEIHRFNKAQQDAFLPHVEGGLIILIGATTQNPSFEVIPPLLSRARVMVLHALEDQDVEKIVLRALKDEEKGLGRLSMELSPEALKHLIAFSGGDARVALNNLEIAVYSVLSERQGSHIVDLQAVERSLNRKALPYDKNGEEHYNLISAFHKSLRGSDPQSSIYWLYRMLMAGEEPLFIARRMIRFASEDIGLADPEALQVALTAFECWRRVGPPEAELALAQAALYLAAAPKSNALYLAEKAVREEIDRSGAQPVPLSIRNAPTPMMKKMGYGRGYLYPHDYPGGWVNQDYFPSRVKNRTFYRPTARGFEKEIMRRLAERRREK